MKHRDYWYKNAIIYCLDVETFMDGNGDGIGDFKGLISRLDEIASLGVTCIWLLPFYATPNHDNGYDISDYYNIDSRLGTLGDFVEFIRQAEEYGLRVIVDLVINHTSIEHPWFQAARKDPKSKYRDYYIWRDKRPDDHKEGIIFPGYQETTWTYDEEAGAYYLHQFYKEQPDLNNENPDLREEIRHIIGFWLQLGVSGFRLDAIPFVIGHQGKKGTKADFHYLKELHDFVSWRRAEAILLAEANIKPHDIMEYFGDGDKIHMILNFRLAAHLYLALATGKAKALKEGLGEPQKLPELAEWGNFLRNHDELNLDKLEPDEQAAVYAAFAPEEHMQIYERGIRRRLAPMLNNDRRCLELAYSLMFSLPGTPVLWYGDEIGMGDDLSLDQRNSVRTPMQWSDDPNAGFSTAKRSQLVRPVIDKGEYRYKKVNFRVQSYDDKSLLNWLRKMIQLRRGAPEIGYGEWYWMETGNPHVFAHCCHDGEERIVTVHNLSGESTTVKLNFKENNVEYLYDLFQNRRCELDDKKTCEFELDGYGYRWFRGKSG